MQCLPTAVLAGSENQLKGRVRNITTGLVLLLVINTVIVLCRRAIRLQLRREPTIVRRRFRRESVS